VVSVRKPAQVELKKGRLEGPHLLHLLALLADDLDQLLHVVAQQIHLPLAVLHAVHGALLQVVPGSRVDENKHSDEIGS
jgi:hypothetical protein